MTRSTTKKANRFLAFIMVAVLLATCLPVSVLGANEELLPLESQATESPEGNSSDISENDSVSVIEGNDIGEYVEDISRREENVKHFALPDGTYTAIVYPTAVHRKDADGVWQDINNDLALSSVKGTQKYATTDSRVSFARSFAPSAELMTLSENGYSISMSLISDSKNESVMRASTESFGLASVTNATKKELPKTDVKLEDVAKVDNKSSIVYNNIRANTDIEYILDGNDVKENIIVRAASSEYEYTFDLRLDGLVAILNENGSISVNDAETGVAKYIIPAPYMYDASGEMSYAVEYTLIEVSSGRYLLSVTADKTWINATGREFPVTIDPTIVPDTMMTDTYVSSISPNSIYSLSTELLVGDGYTTLMRLYFPNLDTGITLNQIYLYFNYYFEEPTMDAVTVGAYQITEDWMDNTTNYNNMPTISTIQLSSTMLMGDMGSATEPYMVQMSITEAAKNWFYYGEDNNGIALVYENGIGTASIKSYDSGYNTCEFISVNYSLGLPCSGYEITYDPTYWNNEERISDANCYAYVLNNIPTNTVNYDYWIDVGQPSGRSPITIDSDTIEQDLRADAAALGIYFERIGKYDVCAPGHYKIAVVVASNKDYHFYRQNPDGTWSHKVGYYRVIDFDSSGYTIYDPEFANRSYSEPKIDYSEFVGFFEVSAIQTPFVTPKN